MKILFISENYPPHVEGGAEISTSLLANWLQKEKNDVTVATGRFFPDTFTDENGIKIVPILYRASLGSKGFLSSIRYALDILFVPRQSNKALLKLIIKENPDIINIVVTLYYYMPIVSFLYRHTNAKIVVDCRDYSMICPAQFKGQELADPLEHTHGYRCLKDMYKPANKFLQLFSKLFAHYESFVFNRYKSRLRSLVERSNRVVLAANSEYVRQQFISNGFPKEKVVTIYNISQTVPDLYLPKFETPTFVYGGRIEKEKGIWDLVHAAELLQKETDKPISIKIAGSGDELGALKEYITRNNLNYIEVLGHISHDELLKLYVQSLAIIAPSRWPEPFGRFIQESASIGTPVIATRAGGITEGVKDGKTGILFEIGDTESLKNAMHSFLLTGNQSVQFGEASKQDQKKYEADIVGEKRLSLYKSR